MKLLNTKTNKFEYVDDFDTAVEMVVKKHYILIAEGGELNDFK